MAAPRLPFICLIGTNITKYLDINPEVSLQILTNISVTIRNFVLSVTCHLLEPHKYSYLNGRVAFSAFYKVKFHSIIMFRLLTRPTGHGSLF